MIHSLNIWKRRCNPIEYWVVIYDGFQIKSIGGDGGTSIGCATGAIGGHSSSQGDVVKRVENIMEEELTCSICSELFINAVSSFEWLFWYEHRYEGLFNDLINAAGSGDPLVWPQLLSNVYPELEKEERRLSHLFCRDQSRDSVSLLCSSNIQHWSSHFLNFILTFLVGSVRFANSINTLLWPFCSRDNYEITNICWYSRAYVLDSVIKQLVSLNPPLRKHYEQRYKRFA